MTLGHGAEKCRGAAARVAQELYTIQGDTVCDRSGKKVNHKNWAITCIYT